MNGEHKTGDGAPAAADLPGERLLRLPQVMQMTALGRTSIFDAVKAGTFPRPVKHGAATMWLWSECQAWIEKLKSDSRGVHQ